MVKRNGTRAKITDVAKLAGVSMATVSCILKDPDNNRFSDETNKKVLSAVKELNFRPATFAQQMKGKTLPVIGLVIPSLMNHFYPEVTSGFTDQANKLGYNVIFANTDNSIEREQSFIDTMISLGVAGVGLCGVDLPDEREKELVKRLINLGIPVVRLDRYLEEPDCPCVGLDNFRAGYFMTEKIIQLGHRNIGCLAPYEIVQIVSKRCRGYMEAMKAHGLLPKLCKFHRNEFGSIYKALEEAWTGEDRVSALFAIGGDIDAIECIKCASRLNIQVPFDLSIAGFDDIYISEIINPSLTTIKQPKFEIGATAMRILKSLIDGDDVEEEMILLPFEYIARESVNAIG